MQMPLYKWKKINIMQKISIYKQRGYAIKP